MFDGNRKEDFPRWVGLPFFMSDRKMQKALKVIVDKK
jgi:hypothetical protein